MGKGEKFLRFDSVGGVSGDMALGALAGLFDDPMPGLEAALASMLGRDAFELRLVPVAEGGWTGNRMVVEVNRHEHVHRHLGDIRAMIMAASLPEPVKDMAVAVFTSLAAAEAKVHGTTIEHVHFHEVGALDSIIDIVGACHLFDQLGCEWAECSPLPLGTGEVKCAHGVMPLPVPAVAELLRGFPVKRTSEPFELVTPTGAALVTTWAARRPLAAATETVHLSTRHACGFGQRRLNQRPNLLRASLCETSAELADGICCSETVVVLETNLDDCPPELIAAASDRLFAAGALDVFTIAAQMKKGRHGVLLGVIAAVSDIPALEEIIFRETGTFGIRRTRAERTTLERRQISVATQYGEARIKVGNLGGRETVAAPEFDDCERLAKAAAVPLAEVYREVAAAYRSAHG